jgi:hypothetical protein
MLTLNPLADSSDTNHLADQLEMWNLLSEAVELATAESPWVPPHPMPVSSDSTTNMFSTQILSPHERHCFSLAGRRRVVGMKIFAVYLLRLGERGLAFVYHDI